MAEQVVVRDLPADRDVWFIRKFAWIGRDFTGATFKMQVRANRNTTGAPLLNMTNANIATDPLGITLLYAGTATITAHIAAGRLSGVPNAVNPATGVAYVGGDSVLLSQVEMFVEDTLMQGLPLAETATDDKVLQYDFLVQPSGGIADVEMTGKFIVRAGVTIP